MSQGRLEADPAAPKSGQGGRNGARFARAARASSVRLVSPEAGIPEGGVGVDVAARDRLRRRVLALSDIGSVGLALLVAIVLLGRGDRLQIWVLGAIPLIVLINKAAGLYDRDEHVLNRGTLDEAPTLFQSATLFTLAFWLGQHAFVDGWFGQRQLLGLLVTLLVMMLLTRAAARRALRRATSPDRCLLIGDGASAERLRQKLGRSAELNAELVGWLPLRQSAASSNGSANGAVPMLGQLDMLGVLVIEHDVERVIIAPGNSDPDEILGVIKLVRALGVRVSVLPTLFEAVGSAVEFDSVEGEVLLGVRSYGLSKSSRLLKRAMDVVCAGMGLLLFAPLLTLVAVAVGLDSRGPVLFRQRRVGIDGEEFEMFKFRTMVDGADVSKADLLELNEARGLFKIAEDPRLTRVGRLIRPSFIDELPQLINVLKGDMSLVGPRPLVPDEDLHVDGAHPRRLHLTPGMTGMWQVAGSSRIPLEDMVKIDYLYGANWSLWLDVKLILRTVPTALGRRGF